MTRNINHNDVMLIGSLFFSFFKEKYQLSQIDCNLYLNFYLITVLEATGAQQSKQRSRVIKVPRTKDLRNVNESLHSFLPPAAINFHRASPVLSAIADITLSFTVRTIKLASTPELILPSHSPLRPHGVRMYRIISRRAIGTEYVMKE